MLNVCVAQTSASVLSLSESVWWRERSSQILALKFSLLMCVCDVEVKKLSEQLSPALLMK